MERLQSDLVLTFSQESEKGILDSLIKAGIFNVQFISLLQEVHEYSNINPELYYFSRVKTFFETSGLAKEPIFELYVARVLSNPHDLDFFRGYGYNFLFSGADASFGSVRTKYLEQCQTLGVEEVVLPFNILFGAPIYFMDRKFDRAWVSPRTNYCDIVSRHKLEFTDKIKTGEAAYFRLGVPAI